VTRFIFLTKTCWEEPPRIRHQLAQLLGNAGYEVLFFEKPAGVGQPLPAPRKGAQHITVAQHHELIHHKLRLMPVVHRLNAAVVRRSLQRVLAKTDFGSDAVVVNFNYDYWFLRDLFPRQRVFTLINDDFISTALFGITAPLRWALVRTCRASDHVLTVSEPLQEQLAGFCTPRLFLPWADRCYVAPAQDAQRDLLLFWGFINNKIDFNLLQRVCRGLLDQGAACKVMLAGPVEGGVENQLRALGALPNVIVAAATPLDALPLPRVLAALIPYRCGVPEIEAIALPNKALQLLARGLPLLVTGMPNFIQAPFVFRLDGTESPAAVVEHITSRFTALQPSIESCVVENAGDARLRQFLELVA
jgi:hypothetical protein